MHYVHVSELNLSLHIASNQECSSKKIKGGTKWGTPDTELY